MIHTQHNFFDHSMYVVLPVPQKLVCAVQFRHMIIKAATELLYEALIVWPVVIYVQGYNLRRFDNHSTQLGRSCILILLRGLLVPSDTGASPANGS